MAKREERSKFPKVAKVRDRAGSSSEGREARGWGAVGLKYRKIGKSKVRKSGHSQVWKGGGS